MNARGNTLGLPTGCLMLLLVAHLGAGCDGRPGPLCDHGNINSVATSPSGTVLAVVGRYGRSHDGRLSLYDTRTGTEIAARLWPNRALLSAAFDMSAKRLAVSDEAGQVLIFQLQESAETDEGRLKLAKQSSAISRANDLVFSPDDSLLALACADHVVRLVHSGTGAIAAELRGHTGAVSAVAFGPDGRRIASAGGSDGTIKVWDVAQRTLSHTLAHGAADVSDLTFTPDGSRIVASYGDSLADPWVVLEYPSEQVRTWDAVSGELIRSFRVGGDRVTSVSPSPSRGLVIAGYTHEKGTTTDHAVAVISASSGERECTLRSPWRAPVARCYGSSHAVVVDGRSISSWDVSEPGQPRKMWEKEWRWQDKISRLSPMAGSTAP